VAAVVAVLVTAAGRMEVEEGEAIPGSRMTVQEAEAVREEHQRVVHLTTSVAPEVLVGVEAEADTSPNRAAKVASVAAVVREILPETAGSAGAVVEWPTMGTRRTLAAAVSEAALVYRFPPQTVRTIQTRWVWEVAAQDSAGEFS
jgi:hypothetical protein